LKSENIPDKNIFLETKVMRGGFVLSDSLAAARPPGSAGVPVFFSDLAFSPDR
jgi:hypothetical protein